MNDKTFDILRYLATLLSC